MSLTTLVHPFSCSPHGIPFYPKANVNLSNTYTELMLRICRRIGLPPISTIDLGRIALSSVTWLSNRPADSLHSFLYSHPCTCVAHSTRDIVLPVLHSRTLCSQQYLTTSRAWRLIPRASLVRQPGHFHRREAPALTYFE